jgi:methionyl-tRNA formyltransferase
MRLIFAGTPDVAAVSLQALLASRHEVTAVLTRPPARAGRGRAVQESPVAHVAREAGIDICTDHTQIEALLARHRPDCCPVVAYGMLIPEPVLRQPRFGWVNVHFSLLPRWRGAAPVQWAIRAGDERTGVSIFQLDAGLDTGPILASESEVIAPDDTSGAVLERLGVRGAAVLVATLDGLEAGVIHPVTQPDIGATFAPKITVDDARIDWQTSSVEIDRHIRSCTPQPGAWTMLGDTRLRIGSAHPIATAGNPGEITATNDAVCVGAQSGSLRLERVQPAGKSMMDALAWWRGARLAAPVHLT